MTVLANATGRNRGCGIVDLGPTAIPVRAVFRLHGRGEHDRVQERIYVIQARHVGAIVLERGRADRCGWAEQKLVCEIFKRS
jgi:hypothetical protein